MKSHRAMVSKSRRRATTTGTDSAAGAATTTSTSTSTVTPQQAVFELKQKLIVSLNKLADRDTHQIAVHELHNIAQSLTPQGIPPFLSCITDTADSDHKTAVRKECIRLMATFARFHAAAAATPAHIAKMLATIVKRLKDSDSSVRDACVDTAAALAAATLSLTHHATAFVGIVKPLFEALGEQSRYVQAGSALCLARVIDDTDDPPPSLLPHMLTRVVKLLKNPHFMAKPAVIELIRSIVQAFLVDLSNRISVEQYIQNAGGASTEHALSAAVTSVQETLKSTDWTTRKAASVALAGIAVCAGPLLGSFKTSCIQSLESCRFDKVKPVRDTIMYALQCWKTVPGTGSSEPSEAGSSTKENMNGDYSDVTSATDGGWRDISCGKVGPVSAFSGTSSVSSKKRNPLTVQKTYPNYVQNHHHPSSNDWHVEISLSKRHVMSSGGSDLKEFVGSCTSVAFERTAEANKGHNIKYDYDPAENHIECSSMSDLVSGSFETKHVTVDEDTSSSLIGLGHRSATEDVDPEGPRMQERKSLDSTVTEQNSHGMQGCCMHTSSELAFIRKQLLEIETKQSNLLDLLQVFVGNSVDNLSTLQLKVLNLEHVVDQIVKSFSQNRNYSNMTSSKFMRNNQNVSSSSRLSTSTPRLSVESNYRQSSLSSLNSKEVWGVNASSTSRSSTSVKEGVELWRDPTLNIVRNNVLPKGSVRNAQNTASRQTRVTRDALSVSDHNAIAKQSKMEGKNGFWGQIMEFLHSGDVESAYAATLCSGEDLCLIELMDRTGPVLEKLSCETTNVVISILTTHFLNQRFTDSIIPWFLQMVDLCGAREPGNLVMSSKTQIEFLYALREAAAMECIDRVDRIAITECASKLSQLWGAVPSRKVLAVRGSRGSKILVPATSD